jgi:hypothetical protein
VSPRRASLKPDVRDADRAERPATPAAKRELQRSITLPQAVALYAGAVVGAGVLILLGVAAS